MNTGLKNKLLILAAAAGLSGYGVACGGDAPAAEEGGAEETTGGEASCSGGEGSCSGEAEGGGDEAAPDEGGGEAEGGGEGSCGEGSCS